MQRITYSWYHLQGAMRFSDENVTPVTFSHSLKCITCVGVMSLIRELDTYFLHSIFNNLFNQNVEWLLQQMA